MTNTNNIHKKQNRKLKNEQSSVKINNFRNAFPLFFKEELYIYSMLRIYKKLLTQL